MDYTFTSQMINEQLAHNPFQKLNSAVYQVILHGIIYLDIKPGEKLVEKAIAEQLGVSRTPVHVALEKLASAGFVTELKNRVCIVNTLSVDFFKDLFIARSGIESRACAQACERMTDQERLILRKKLELFEIAQKERDQTRMTMADQDFHQYIVECSRNAFMISEYEMLVPYLNYFRMLFSKYLIDNFKGMYEEHAVICNAIDSRFSAICGRTMKNHLHLILSLSDEQFSKWTAIPEN